MPTLDRIHSLVRPYAPAAPNTAVDQAILLAAREFCTRTRCWRSESTQEVEAVEAHDIVPPADGEVFEIAAAWFEGQKLCSVQDAEFAAKTIEPMDGAPRVFVFDLGTSRIRVAGVAAGTLKVAAFIQPILMPWTDGMTTLPAGIIDRFGEALADGAVARLTGAALQLSRFERACDQNFAHSLEGAQNARMRVQSSFI